MSDLHLAPPREGSRLPAIIIAAVVLALIAWAICSFLPSSTSKVSITGVHVYAPHTVFNPMRKSRGGNVVNPTPQTEDDLYLVLTVAVKDQFRMPVSIDAATASLTTADGATLDGSTVARNDIARLDQIFPDLAALTPHPLSYNEEIKPGETIEKQIVVQFPGLNAEAWQAKKALTLTVSMHNQPPQTVVLH